MKKLIAIALATVALSGCVTRTVYVQQPAAVQAPTETPKTQGVVRLMNCEGLSVVWAHDYNGANGIDLSLADGSHTLEFRVNKGTVDKSNDPNYGGTIAMAANKAGDMVGMVTFNNSTYALISGVRSTKAKTCYVLKTKAY